jgi:hypothetical protein
MKRIVFLTFIGSLTLVLAASGAQKGSHANRSVKGRSAPSVHAVSAKGSSHIAPARMSHSFGPRAGARSVTQGSAPRSSRPRAARIRSAQTANRAPTAKTFAHSRAALNRERNLTRANTRTGRMEAARLRSQRITQANARTAAGSNLAVNRQSNLTFARNVAINRAGNTRIVNYWRSAPFHGANYAAFYNYNRTWHDSGWWVSNYPWIIYAYPMGGWWYWNAGYWYPAWGYDPYAYYPYDGPIYGYGDLTPDRIVENVQLALQQQGYYAGPIDGILGSQTRGALAAFQADHGLAVTSAADRPTLQSLGLT